MKKLLIQILVTQSTQPDSVSVFTLAWTVWTTGALP